MVNRGALLLTGAAATAGLLAGGSGTAFADVSVTPDQAVRGGATEVTVRVTDERADAYTTKVELRFPAQTPIAEIYPMSVPDWAPKITNRTIDQALGGLHHGQTTQVVSAITWLRTGPANSVDPAELTVSMGPLPQVDGVLLEVVQTYSDGTVVNWSDPPTAGSRPAHPAALLRLVPAADQPPAAAVDDAGVQDAPVDDADAPVDAEPGLGGRVLGGIALGVVLGAGIMLLLRRRTAPAAGPEVEDEPIGDAPPTPVGPPVGEVAPTVDGKPGGGAARAGADPSGEDSPAGDEASAPGEADAAVVASAAAGRGRGAWRLHE